MNRDTEGYFMRFHNSGHSRVSCARHVGSDGKKDYSSVSKTDCEKCPDLIRITERGVFCKAPRQRSRSIP